MAWLVAVLCLLIAGASAPAAWAQRITTENVGSAETEAGNILADAVRAAGGADIGFVPAVAFKPGASAPRPATPAQAAGLVEPADDRVVVLSLRGEEVLAALERSVSFAPQRSSGFLQVSGLRFVYDPGRSGKRVVSASVNGQDLKATGTYRVAMTRPLASGQQGYFQIWSGKDARDTGKTLAEALRDRGGSLSAPPEGRITARGR
uniref:5'-Nucleotidase C-terminal domain-containing protein n=1 Tax=uncultured Armatimonadetes bacterium TaxID=157466 RepID=A0A6J4IVJ7_9BACT|nr:hypothetical protein AVDCRST_MAG63-2464 [uncultured Armatimonadetes bacterium]